MTLSLKAFNAVYQEDGSLDKSKVMQNCYEGFQVYICDVSLEKIGGFFQHDIVYSNITWTDGHRCQANANISSIDVIPIDMDKGTTSIDMVLELPFQVMCLTTTSHTPEKPKFRVFVPLLEAISLNNNQEYKELMRLMSEKYFNNEVDVQTMEIGRAYITTTKAEYYLNNKTELFDANALLSTVRKNIQFKELARQLKNSVNSSIKTRVPTIDQVLQYPKVRNLISELGEGNHYGPVFKILGIGIQAGLSNHDAVSLVMDLNIGGEYSNYDSLIKKVERYS